MSVNNSDLSKKVKKSYRSLKGISGTRQQPSVLVASTGGSTGQQGIPFCDFCEHSHFWGLLEKDWSISKVWIDGPSHSQLSRNIDNSYSYLCYEESGGA